MLAKMAGILRDVVGDPWIRKIQLLVGEWRSKFFQLYGEHPSIIAFVLSICAVLVVSRLHILPVLLQKCYLYTYSFIFMIASADTKGLKKVDPPPLNVSGAKLVEKRRVVFLRHGESEWNLVFNKKPIILLPFRLVIALIREWLMIFLHPGVVDSIFIDSPLNQEGMEQAIELNKGYAHRHAIQELRTSQRFTVKRRI